MNKIILIKNKLEPYNDSNIIINNNEITFLKSGEYTIEYMSFNKINLTINIEDNLNIKLFEFSNNQDISSNIIYNLNNNSNLNIYKFYNNKEVLEEIIINLNKNNAQIDYHFSNICSNKEYYNMIINHNASNTESRIINKSITEKEANLFFKIDSILPKGNRNCKLNQQTRIITLEDSYAKIEPNMYIEEDDVEAKHGSVIGNFSNDELFYLMTRGITKEESIKLLIKGLIFSNLKVGLEERAQILNIINEKWR